MAVNLSTRAEITWCSGCGNFAIMNSIKTVLKMLAENGTGLSDIVLVSGIGCHAKIVDYINVNSFYSIHGRTVPAATGIKLAQPNLKVIAFAGDGDAYGEGLEHLIFAAKRNVDITVIIHNNRVYGLTVGQYTPTSPAGFRGRSTPQGSKERPLNPLEIMLASGATFIARGYSNKIDLLKKIFHQAIIHKGFAIVDVLQVCVTFFNLYDYYNRATYELTDHDPSDYEQALKKIKEWNYNTLSPIALGVFFQKDLPTFEEQLPDWPKDEPDRLTKIRKLLKLD